MGAKKRLYRYVNSRDARRKHREGERKVMGGDEKESESETGKKIRKRNTIDICKSKD